MTLRALAPPVLGVVALAVVGYVVAGGGTSAPYPPTAVAPPTRAMPAPAAQEIVPAAAEESARVSPSWLAATGAKAGIPVPALRAYATAQLRMAEEDPACRLGWTTLAGIGWVESEHGTYGGRTLGENGRPSSPILGPTLDGSGDVAAVAGEHGDWARAAGPMQFLPSTWSRWRSDGDGDGVRDAQDLDDAAYAAGRYLCASGPLSSGPGWARAVLSYNHSQAYVDRVYATAEAYAQRTG